MFVTAQKALRPDDCVSLTNVPKDLRSSASCLIVGNERALVQRSFRTNGMVEAVGLLWRSVGCL